MEGGATKGFYANADAIEVIKTLKRSELSKICNGAILEHGGASMTLEMVEKKLESSKNEREVLNIKIEFLENKKIEFLKLDQFSRLKKAEISEIVEKIKKRFGMPDELIERLKKGSKPNLTTTLHLYKKYKIKTIEIRKAWDMLHVHKGKI